MCQGCPERAHCEAERKRGEFVRYRFTHVGDFATGVVRVCQNFQHITGHRVRQTRGDSWWRRHISHAEVDSMQQTFKAAASVFFACCLLRCADGRAVKLVVRGYPMHNTVGDRLGHRGIVYLRKENGSRATSA